MHRPPQIVFRGFEPSPSLRELVDAQVERLERHHPRITACRVSVDKPHQHHKKGHAWHINVSVGVSGDEIVVNREPERDFRHEDPRAAVHDAFDTLHRRLQERARRAKGRARHQERDDLQELS